MIPFLHLTRLSRTYEILKTFFANWEEFEFQEYINVNGNILHVERRYWSMKSETSESIVKKEHIKSISVKFVMKQVYDLL